MAVSIVGMSAAGPRPVFSPEGGGWTRLTGSLWWKTAGSGDADLFFRIQAQRPKHVTAGNLLIFDEIENQYAEFSGRSLPGAQDGQS